MKINKNAYAAGIILGLCSFVYAICENHIVGAFLFGIGLTTICQFKLELFTGRVGSSNDIKHLLEVFVFNFLGVITIKVFVMYCTPYLILGVMCGMLMQIGVASYKNNQLITIMCVAAFILSGSQHCIAMIYYQLTLNWLLVILGNILGAKIMYYLGVKQNGND